MNHLVEASGRVVPALDFTPTDIATAPRIEGLSPGTTRCGQPTVTRINPTDGLPESFGVFASPAIAAHFLKTFGGARA